MARTITVRCDIPGCGNETLQGERAGTLEGWLRREVKDGVKKVLAEGVRDFDARVVFHVCPACLACASELPSPETHPEVLEFVEQVESSADYPGELVQRRQLGELDPQEPEPEPEQEQTEPSYSPAAYGLSGESEAEPEQS